MSSTQLDTVTAQALQLTADERAELIERLVGSVSGGLHPAWELELQARLDEMELEPETSRPAAEVFNELQQQLRESQAPGRG